MKLKSKYDTKFLMKKTINSLSWWTISFIYAVSLSTYLVGFDSFVKLQMIDWQFFICLFPLTITSFNLIYWLIKLIKN